MLGATAASADGPGLFDSTWFVACKTGAFLLLAFFFLLSVAGVWRDARHRCATGPCVVAGTLLAMAVPFAGPLAWLLLRPFELLEDRRERDLVLRELEARLRLPARCAKCGAHVEDDFVVCPICRERLKKPCRTCGRSLEPDWVGCPHCATPALADTHASLDSAAVEQ